MRRKRDREELAVSLHVQEAGTLATLIEKDQKKAIMHLTLTGELNGTDIVFLREMMGRSRYNRHISGFLKTLDLSGVEMVGGGDWYRYRYYYVYAAAGEIPKGMFAHSSLRSVALPKNITSIGDWALYSSPFLSTLKVPAGVTSIGRKAFGGYNGTSITIPKHVTSLGEFAFYSCVTLLSVKILGRIPSIAYGLFSDCRQLASVNIPDSVTSIEAQAFYRCHALPAITLPDGVTSIGGHTFRECSKLASIHIPKGVTVIEERTFEKCTSLAGITLPEGITSIRRSAFAGCTALTEIHSKNPIPPALGETCFEGVSKAVKLYVPKGAEAAYRASGWAEFECIPE